MLARLVQVWLATKTWRLCTHFSPLGFTRTRNSRHALRTTIQKINKRVKKGRLITHGPNENKLTAIFQTQVQHKTTWIHLFLTSLTNFSLIVWGLMRRLIYRLSLLMRSPSLLSLAWLIQTLWIQNNWWYFGVGSQFLVSTSEKYNWTESTRLKREGKNKVQTEERGKHGWLLTLSAKQKAVRAGCMQTGKELEQRKKIIKK